ncbi:BTB/POZ domain-containing protein 1 [Apiospora rasikravindrae]|uniref:BTB/POZ domain-containing protein 1 n=1 Tax=Apiospora rasikravindrae TaxID=990691 RepID=A0ABR1THQ5_9PEZI
MSHLLWKYYWENDVDRFRRLLAPAGYSQNTYPSKGPGIVGVGSPGAFGSSPRPQNKSRKVSGQVPGGFSKADLNSRDHAGLTLLLRAASSTSANAILFVEALLDHSAIDLYAQDFESGWNALHRALYNGNISIARLLLDKERKDLHVSIAGGNATKVGHLIKTKDNEGNSPFDVYNATIALRSLRMAEERAKVDDDSDSEAGSDLDENGLHSTKLPGLGEELFTFGSNKNLSLGLGDQDDRQFPERVFLQRPEHLVQYFYDKHLQHQQKQRSLEESFTPDLSEVPALIQSRPLYVQDAEFSKLHSAVLTTDPISNLYVCGVGRGGRLGLGDENTRFHFTPVQGPLLDKQVVSVALGQNHTLAITTGGELWTWGLNTFSQLGYVLPPPLKADEEPMSTSPRQVYGPLKKEVVLGIAASSIHSVAHTGSSLYCWGKNVGQLALMDADSRSLEVQPIPRKVAASLLSSHSSIVMVSAIDKATTCLFEDRTVCVFTNYGYNMIKFPFFDSLTNSTLQRSGRLSLSSRYDPGRKEIRTITSGGETIAALTGSGDLFTMSLNLKNDGSSSAISTSTTNPARIKDAVTTPQLIWSSKKDGAASVSVAENGSVVISTQSGAVWRRIKRIKAKDTKAGGLSDGKRKDFKFQRVPFISGVAAVRSSPFGAYAAVRKDCDVTREQVEVDEQNLWDDMAPLCALRGFKATNGTKRENKDTWKFQDPDVLKGRVDTLGYEVLTSTDLEEDMESHLRQWKYQNDSTGAVVCTSSCPGIQIPVHTWVMSCRSPILRMGLQRFREMGVFEIPELLTVYMEDDNIVIKFSGIDLITLLNFVVYSYVDRVIPAWNFTRQSPPLASRYRQIRNELMKVATRLGMLQLEQSARLQSSPSRTMDQDYRKAIEDPEYFEDGDALLELDGDEIPVHSTLLCQRCPWFQGLFNGRSGGMWLANRMEGQNITDKVPIDLKHLDPESFHYVLQHLYGDVGEELFDDVIADSIDEFSELVVDVMNIANELMIDRLSQICQKILGRFVTMRNISTLLNLISMESMLENHLLDNLDEELLLELDEVVRDNQLARCPFARSGRADLLLHERYPQLASDIDEERQRRVREMAYKAISKDEEKKISSSFKARIGSLDDMSGVSLTPDKTRQKSRTPRNEPFSPELRPKDSQADLMFDMDDDGSSSVSSPLSPCPRPLDAGLRKELDQLQSLSESSWKASKGKSIQRAEEAIASPPTPLAMRPALSSSSSGANKQTSSSGVPWAAAPLPTSKLGLQDIMNESKSTQSALSAELAAEKKEAAKLTPQKLSQKERKKFLQQQAEEAAREEAQAAQQRQTPWIQVDEKKAASPWKSSPAPPKTSIKDVLSSGTKSSSLAVPGAKPLVAAESSGKSTPRRTASPDTRFPGQNRSGSATPRGSAARTSRSNQQAKTAGPPQVSPSPSSVPENKPLVPHSKSYIQKTPRQSESLIGLGLADIIDHQRREQESVKEAVAKRSLQEIQQEQAFQEWWDQESRRTQEEEARRVAREKDRGRRRQATVEEKVEEGSRRTVLLLLRPLPLPRIRVAITTGTELQPQRRRRRWLQTQVETVIVMAMAEGEDVAKEGRRRDETAREVYSY